LNKTETAMQFGNYYTRMLCFSMTVALLTASSLVTAAEAVASTPSVASSEWARAMEPVAAACSPKRTYLLHALHAQLTADRQMQLEATAWKQNVKVGSQNAKMYSQHLHAIEKDLLAAVPNIQSQVYVLAEAAAVQADWLKERAAEDRHAALDTETVMQERYAAAVGALGSTLDMLTSTSGNINNKHETVTVLSEGGDARTTGTIVNTQGCQHAVQRALELMDEEKWLTETAAMEKQIVADAMMAVKARRSNFQQDWHAKLSSAVKLATAHAADGDEAAARTRLRELLGQVDRTTRAAIQQRSRNQMALDLLYREFQAGMERLQRELQGGSMIETHGVAGGSLRQQAFRMVKVATTTVPNQAGFDDETASGASSISSTSTKSITENNKDSESKRDALHINPAEVVAVEEGSFDIIWQAIRQAASSAAVHEAAYVYTLLRFAEVHLEGAANDDTQLHKNSLVRQAVADLGNALPAWVTAERDYVNLALRALRQHETVTEADMYTSEYNCQTLYVRVGVAKAVLEAHLPHTMTAGVVHEVGQQVVRKPLAALVGVLVWAGSMHGQVTLMLTIGVLLGVLCSSWDGAAIAGVGRVIVVVTLAVALKAVSVAVLHCGEWFTGCATSVFSAYGLGVVVRGFLSRRNTAAATGESSEAVDPVADAKSSASSNGSSNGKGTPLKKLVMGKKIKQHTVVAAA
jgi:hypothetical protein